jgi:hypothetical protein
LAYCKLIGNQIMLMKHGMVETRSALKLAVR